MHKFFRNKHPFTTHLRRNLQIEESYTALLCLLTQKSNIYVLKFKETIKKKKQSSKYFTALLRKRKDRNIPLLQYY